MKKSKKNQLEEERERQLNKQEEPGLLKSKTIKELIAPSGIDASKIDHLEIISNVKRYARSFFISTLPRMCTFPELFRDLYFFGDVNTSIYITPISESRSQNELNRVINELETERIVAADRGNINRESTLTQKRFEAEQLRDEIAAGFNKMYDASIISTLFAYNLKDLDRYTGLLAAETSKNLVGIKTAWGIQEEAFQSNLPLMNDKVQKIHTFDRNSMGTVFPFTTSEVGHSTGIPLGFNKQTGTPILFDNFHSSLTNYNMVIFAKSGAGKSVTMKTLVSRSSVLMGIESLALDAEGEYKIVAESLGGINVVINTNSNTIINLFDIEPEMTKDEITGKDKIVLKEAVRNVNERIRVLAASCFASEVFHMLRSAACCLVKAFAEQEWAML